MKIAHVITRLIIGGAQENTILTCEGLARRGHDVTLIAGPQTGPEGSLWPRAETFGGRLVRVDSLRREVRPLADAQCARELTRLCRAERFDVVHTHSSKAGILGRYAAHRAGVAHVVHTIHGMSFNRTQRRAIRAAYAAMERVAARWTDAIISVADAMTEQAVAAGVAAREKFVTIRSGMETVTFRKSEADRRSVRDEWGIPNDAVVVGTIARLFRNKGYEHLLAAMPAIAGADPRIRFVWVGDGANREQYLAELRRLGLRERVHLTGLVPPGDIPRLLNGFDVLVHASLWEGLARALVQASLCEVPVVSFDNDGAPEVVEDGRTGFLVPLGDTSLLADRVVRLCADEQPRMEMGRRARESCLRRFDHERMVEDIDALYRKLIGRTTS
jgi:glycosyltransferase involved in cell wall biosynthesis